MPSRSSETSAVQPPVVLLVQPQDDSAELYEWYLGRHGFETMAVSDPDDALRAAPQADIIVTAIRLRRACDGLELVGRLRSDDRTREKQIVVLSASLTPVFSQRAVEKGCDLVLSKPCLPDDLIAQLHQLLARSRSRRLRGVRLRARNAALSARTRRAPGARTKAPARG
jgi:CheY-like chemotaxis protein